mmetsp:Transcript_23716/g.36058  ORF Transcript_23716/g.36058 Transcript_23716/m.36058 type:complete len:168 (+) Transcript_23716:85-588(+)
MIATTQQQNNTAKSSVIQRIGGERDFEFVVLSLVDRLRDDKQLRRFFSTFEPNDLAAHQEEFLRVVFAQANDMDDARTKNDLQVFIHLRYFLLIKQGFDETHFDLTISHIIAALEDAWVDDQDLIDDTVTVLNSVRPIFEQKGQTQSVQMRARTTRTGPKVLVSSSA